MTDLPPPPDAPPTPPRPDKGRHRKPKKSHLEWATWRVHVLFWTGLITLAIGVRSKEPAIMTIGAGLAGFIPATKAINGG